MDSAFPPPPDVDSKPAQGVDDALAPGNVEPKTEPTHLMPQLAPHTSSHSPAPDGVSPQPRQGSRGRTTPKSERPSTRPRGSGGNTSNPSPAAQAPPADDPNARQLNVADALTYLDAVKARFSEAPEVYNMFLDIMKEFKTEQLDTPGVIHRVSTLFRGHPMLIEGFNTFLPAGYHIQCSTDLQTNTITVTTPTGTHTTHTEAIDQPQPPLVPTPDLPRVPSPVQPFLPPTAQHLAPTIGMPPGSPSGHASRGATVLSGMQSSDRDGKPTQPEFSNAIAFINKIKARYQHDQDVYKTFLEILQAFQQKQAKGGSEAPAGIYGQVRKLLAETPDLIDEFRQFLPELAGDAGWDKGPEKTRRKPAAQAMPAPPAPTAPKRKKRPEKEDSLRPSPQKKPKHHHAKDVSPAYQPERAPAPPPIPPRQQQPLPPLQASAITSQQQQQGHQVTGPDELQFFDKVKRQFEDRATYDEFLKLLNLFSKDIIGVKTLVERAKTFLGDTELWTQFKIIVGYNDTKPEPNQPLALTDRVRVVEDCGPSYRRLPPDQVALACSGRDELARSVLNDEWVSHPTWMSEDSVFQSHKKNQYEEALHRSEEERHEYDFHIEALTRTVALLEPIFQKILNMSEAERLAFKLPAGLGAASPSIHLRIMKKVYGREAGLEVALALQETPGIAIPVVLPRLKQKDEEWRRARREWNKVWREIDVRNFYKSLDHQGITYKQNDKKTITAKHLVQQIEAARAEAPRNARPTPQLIFEIADENVLKDAMKLVFSFLDRASSGAGVMGTMYNPREARRVERLLRELVPLFMMIDVATFDAAFGPPPEGEEVVISAPVHDEEEMDTAASTPNKKKRSGTGSNSPRGQQPEDLAAGDLRKRLLTVQHQTKKGQGADDDATSTSGNTEMQEGNERPERGGKKRKAVAAQLSRPTRKRAGDDVWVKHRPDQSLAAAGKGGESVDSPRRRSRGKDEPEPVNATGETSKRTTPSGRLPFFSNTTYYTLFRLLQILYQRLLSCKTHAEQTAANPNASHSANPMAIELGLNDPIYGMVGSLVSPATIPNAKGKSKSKASSRATSAVPRADTPADDSAMDVDKPGRQTPRKGTAPVDGSTPGITGNAAGYFYGHLLESCEKLFDGVLEPLSFEENLRFMFGTKAYVMFTVDKVVAAIVKQLQAALQDNKCIDLLHMLRREREREKEIRRKYEEEAGAVRVSTSLLHERDLQDQIRYRRDAEVAVGIDEHLFKICWTPSQKTLSFQLMKKHDKSFTHEDPPNALERWMQYTASYVMDHSTEDDVLRNSINESLVIAGDGDDNDGARDSDSESGMDDGKIKRPFLKRNLVQDKAPRKKDGTGVEVRFCVTTYKMFFVADKGDAFWVQRPAGDIRAAEERVKARSEGCKLLQ
ncbi:hypothetical protein EXIGLDRAFT_639357 [Exidia glandulosa HHB12029]|uniref:Histone deacetylase interacting domain-containing protein n=1 Tax=Exidia glandulosa HHB12029 TaxID=1314781 RepID=A0A165NDJ6_EXIGL|nr:hypothetical protein EXIGLDRAFT_639357 [Exidia glandulosa HHB12029]